MKFYGILIFMLMLGLTGCGQEQPSTVDTQYGKLHVSLLDTDGSPVSGDSSNLVVTVSVWDGNEIYAKSVVEGAVDIYEEPGDYLIFAEAPGQEFEDVSWDMVDGVQFKKVTITLDENSDETLKYNGKVWVNNGFVEPNVILTIKDSNEQILPYQRMYMGDDKSNAVYYTDAKGILRAKLDPGDYVISLDYIQSYDYKDFSRLELDGRKTIFDFSDSIKRDIVFGDDSALRNAQQTIKDDEQKEQENEQREKELADQREHEEFCNPSGEFAVTRCCAKDFYLVEGDQGIMGNVNGESFSSDELYGHSIEIGGVSSKNGMVHTVFVDDDFVGNSTKKTFSKAGLFLEIVGCGYPAGGWPECCMKITSMIPGEVPYSIGEEKNGFTLEDQDTMIVDDVEYVLSDAFVVGDTVYFRNRTIKDYKDEEVLGVVMQSVKLDFNEYFMKESEVISLGAYDATLLDAGSKKIRVEFNQTSEDAAAGSPVQINGLLVSVDQTFKDSAIVKLG